MINPTLSESASRRSEGCSRRDLLKSLTAGLGGVMATPLFSKPAPRTPVIPQLSATPDVLVRGLLSSGSEVTATGLASYGGGWFFVLTQQTTNSVTTYDLEFVDAHSLNTVFSFVQLYNRALPSTPFLQPVLDDTNVYTANGNTVYIVPLANPMAQAFFFSASANITGNLSLTGGGILLISTSDGLLTAYDAKSRNLLWSVTPGGSINDFSVNGNLVCVSAGSSLYAYNATDGTSLFSASGAAGMVTVSSDSVFITNSQGVYSYSAINGSSQWQYAFSGSGLLAAELYSGFLYALDSTGYLHEIQPGPKQGTDNRQALYFGDAIDQTQPLVFEDGVVYGGSPLGSSSLTIYPLVLATRATSAYVTNLAGRFLGVENGTAFFTYNINNSTNNGGNSIAGVALTPQLNAFFAESELMADDYPGGGVQAQGTSFRTHVLLLDANNNPRPNKAVKIWANEALTLTIESTVPGGSSTTVNLLGGPQSAYWTTTDAAGTIDIICVPANITCPAIYMWGSFMYQVNGEYMVLYADSKPIAQLSAASASDLSNAKAYDNSSLIQSQYSGNTADIATHIQNTLGGVSSAAGASSAVELAEARHKPHGHRRPKLRQFDPNKYVAYPSSSPGLLSAGNYSTNVASTDRRFSPPTTANYSFTLGTPSQMAALAVGAPLSFLGSFREMVDKVVKQATQTVLSVVVTVVDSVVTHVINVADGFYKFVVDTVEAAVASVAAILATVANSIKSAIEWLSYLFDWSDMVANASTMSTAVTTQLQSFSTWIQSEVISVDSYLNTIFGNFTTDIENAFASIITGVGGSATLQSQQINGNNPQQVYGANGASSYTKTQWMNSKIQKNANGASSQSSLVRSRSLGQDPAVAKLLQSGEAFLQTIAGHLSSDFANLPGNLQAQFSKTGSLMNDPKAFVTNLIQFLLMLLEDAAILAVDFVNAVFQAFVNYLVDFVNGAISLLTETIDIPIISTLWSVITSSAPSFNLSFLNLICLLLAIPSTIIIKLAGSERARLGDSNLGQFGQDLLTTGLVVGGLIYAGFDAFSDLSNANSDSGIALVSISLSAALFGLSFPQPVPQDDAAKFVWYAASALPLVYGSYMYAANKYKFGSYLTANAQGASTNGLYGFAMLGTSGLLCYKDPADFKGNDYLTLLQNLFTYLPYFGKSFAEGEAGSPARIGVAIVDVVGDVTGTILGIIPH